MTLHYHLKAMCICCTLECYGYQKVGGIWQRILDRGAVVVFDKKLFYFTSSWLYILQGRIPPECRQKQIGIVPDKRSENVSFITNDPQICGCPYPKVLFVLLVYVQGASASLYNRCCRNIPTM